MTMFSRKTSLSRRFARRSERNRKAKSHRSRFSRLRLEQLEDRQLLSGGQTGIPGQTVGLFINDPAKAYDGYTLLAPNASKTTYLLDNDGNKVHAWPSNYTAGLSAYLLEDGSLLRGAV